MRTSRLRALLGGRATLRGPQRPTLCVHDVPSPRIETGLDGVRIGHLSDLHVRTGFKPRRLHLAVEMMNEARPDFVVLTGDYVCLSSRPLPELTLALKGLRAPAFATLGNHDHWSGAARVRRALGNAGVDVLTNEHRKVSVSTGQLYLVGVDDSVTRHDDPERAFSQVPSGVTQVVLAHDPNSADRLARYRPALILSGHTHGGQLYFERLTPYLSARIGVKYLSGFFEVEGAVLYVTRGLGASVPVRYRAPHELALLTLRSHVQALGLTGSQP